MAEYHKFSISPDVIVSKVDEDIVLLDTKTDNFFALSEVSVTIWEAIADDKSFDQIINILSDKYPDVDLKIIEDDCKMFINQLLVKELIYHK